MDYKKPQSTLVQDGTGIYPLTTADQVIRADGSRIEKNGQVHADVLGGKTLAEIMLDIYPVGAVYISVSITSPASLFGGTWERLQDRFLLAAGSSYSAGSMGGEATHALTTEEGPKHNHMGILITGIKMVWAGEFSGGNDKYGVTTGDGADSPFYTAESGGGQPHNNMPPYMAVYMWKRVS